MKTFIKAALISALRTVAQTAVATIGTGVLITEVDWLAVASASVLAGVLSILTSISTGLPECPECEAAKAAAEAEAAAEEEEF